MDVIEFCLGSKENPLLEAEKWGSEIHNIPTNSRLIHDVVEKAVTRAAAR